MPRCTHAAAYSRTQMLKHYLSILWRITLAGSIGLCWRGCQQELAGLALLKLPSQASANTVTVKLSIVALPAT